ncbi:MAG TPA: hypothetical protein VMG40_02600 [Bryobacteraceae bacterium]|nr:hypothetical protein [Bryobacteraceae bacterium]
MAATRRKGDAKGTEQRASRDEVERFIFDQVESVPHLEALLQLWNSRPQVWSEEDLALRLFVQAFQIRKILEDWSARGLVARGGPALWSYVASSENDRLLSGVADLYRQDLVRVSTAIHLKASTGVREFARAFQFTKKRKPS